MLKQTTETGATLHALFPTMVYHTRLGDYEAFAGAFEQSREEFGFDASVAGSVRYSAGEYHGKILLHQAELLRPFFQTLGAEVANYLRALGMKPAYFDMNCLKSWFVVCEPESDSEENSMVAHNHSCSDISWVYYPDVGESFAPITFHAGRSLSTRLFDAAFHYDWHDERKSAISTINGWNSDTWSIHPKSGDLLLFPGHQLHSIDANTSNEPRVSIAGDIALTLKPEFKNLEFGRTSKEHWLSLPLQ